MSQRRGAASCEGELRPRRRPLHAARHALLYLLVRGLLGLLAALPLRAALALGRALGRLGGSLARRERRRADENLARVLPGLDRAARRALRRRAFAHLGESLAECAQLVGRSALRSRLGTSRSPARFAPGALEALREARAEGRGVIYVTGHLGNWELMAAEVAQASGSVVVLYKPSRDPRLDRLLVAAREALGVRGLDVTQPGHLVAASRALRRGEVLGVLLDVPGPASGGVRAPFLGQPAVGTALVPLLARRTGAAVVAGTIRRTGTCQHEIQIERVGSVDWRAPLAAAGQLAAPLERAILDEPGQWVWSLDRWRDAGSAGASRAAPTVIARRCHDLATVAAPTSAEGGRV